MAALRATGQKPLRLSDGTLVLNRRLAGSMRVAMLPRARLTDTKQLRMRLREAGLGRSVVIISPDAPLPALGKIGALPVFTTAVSAELDLRGTGEIRRAALHQKWRNRLVHGENQRLRVACEILPEGGEHWLLQEDARLQSLRGYRNWPTDLTLAFSRENPGKARLYTAFIGNTPVAAMLFLCHGTVATYHIGHTTARGRKMSAHNLLLWRAMNTLAGCGIKRLDLGPVDTHGAPGLARFKLGTGATARVLGGTWVWLPALGQALRPLGFLDRALMRRDAPSQ